MAFTLHPVAIEDAEDITGIFHEAFKNDHIMSYFHPNVPKNIIWERDLDFYRGLIKEGDIYGGRITKAVETSTGKTVAFARWQYPYTLTPEQKAEKEEKDKNHKRYHQSPEGSNKELKMDFFKQLAEGRKRFIVPEKTYFLHILAVDPAYHRRGIGSMLIRPGLAAADKDGAQTFIEASPAGLPLYLRHGWEPVHEMVIDMRPHGGTGIEVMPMLMREPNVPNNLGTLDTEASESR